MNILITSAGRRVKIVEYFKSTFHELDGKIIAVDCDKNAPALYFADDYEIIPRIDDPHYLTSLINICEKYSIKGIVSLIDPELKVLAENKNIFSEMGIQLILSPLKVIDIFFDKFKTYKYLSQNGIKAVPTYNCLEVVEKLIDEGKFDFPLVVKPAKGSASIGITVVNCKNELISSFQNNSNMIIQPYFKEKEFGIDAYIDLISLEPVDMFIKEKIRMRAGETDKSLSVYNDHIEELVLNLLTSFSFLGPIDIDCFEYKGEFYISEINPRFGGGYPHAYEMNCNFMNYIYKNLKGEKNPTYQNYQYKENTVMMKYDHVMLK